MTLAVDIISRALCIPFVVAVYIPSYLLGLMYQTAINAFKLARRDAP